jgi:hypothetical protein
MLSPIFSQPLEMLEFGNTYWNISSAVTKYVTTVVSTYLNISYEHMSNEYAMTKQRELTSAVTKYVTTEIRI